MLNYVMIKPSTIFRKSLIVLGFGLIMLPNIATTQSQSKDIRPNAQQITGEPLLKLFQGKTHDGAYNLNTRGVASATYEEIHHDDGSVTYIEDGIDYEGVWLIKQEKICYFYAHTLNHGCYRVYQVKNCYYFYSDRLPERPDELDQTYWTARSVLKGEIAECVASIA